MPIVPSNKSKTMSESSIVSFALFMPIFSTVSILLSSLMPAVSVKVALIPLISKLSVIISLVVPAISVTIALLNLKAH